jgi:hypothetical protein
VRPIAAWLVARPQNAIIGLAATLLLPFAQVISGTVMSLLVLKQGAAPATLQGLVAMAILSLSSLIVSAPVSQVMANALVVWVPVMLMSALLRGWRSLTLTLQVTAIVALGAVVAFHAVLGDPAAFWTEVLTRIAAAFRDMGLEQQAGVVLEQRATIAPQMTMLVVLTTWSLYTMVLLFGYAVYRKLPGETPMFGRFCDLNFGRVLALIMAATAVIAVVSGAVWLQNVAFVAFAVFWLQGLAIVHWLHAEGRLPMLVVVLVYALIPLLNAVFVLGLAAAGYVDAWYGFRTRRPAA